MQIRLNKEFVKFGFGSGQYMYLIHISYHRGITQKELSRDLAIDKGTTAKAIGKLIEQGYVFSKPDKNDNRSSRLYLTETGKNILPKVKRILNEMSKILKKDMNSIEEMNALSALRKISKNIVERPL